MDAEGTDMDVGLALGAACMRHTLRRHLAWLSPAASTVLLDLFCSRRVPAAEKLSLASAAK